MSKKRAKKRKYSKPKEHIITFTRDDIGPRVRNQLDNYYHNYVQLTPKGKYLDAAVGIALEAQSKEKAMEFIKKVDEDRAKEKEND